MSVNGFIYGTAVFRAKEPGVIIVTQDGDVFGEPFQGSATAPPKRLHLAPLPWSSIPGAEWTQDSTGAWSIRVYRDANVTADRVT